MWTWYFFRTSSMYHWGSLCIRGFFVEILSSFELMRPRVELGKTLKTKSLGCQSGVFQYVQHVMIQTQTPKNTLKCHTLRMNTHISIHINAYQCASLHIIHLLANIKGSEHTTKTWCTQTPIGMIQCASSTNLLCGLKSRTQFTSTSSRPGC